MAWTEVETPNAKYILIFGSHKKPSEPSPVKFDALVLEANVHREELVKHVQYKPLVGQAVEGGKPIWLTDVNPSLRGYVRAGSVIGTTFGTFVVGGFALGQTLASRKNLSRRQLLKTGLFLLA